LKSQNPQSSQIVIPHLTVTASPHPLTSRLTLNSNPQPQAAEGLKVPQLSQLFVGCRESSPSLVVGHHESSPQLSSPSLAVGHRESSPQLNSPSSLLKTEKLALISFARCRLPRFDAKFNTSQPSVRESNNVTESNTEIEISKDIPDRVEIEETSEEIVRGSERLRLRTTSRELKLKHDFNMISRNTLKGDILKIYKDERTKYYNLLGKIKFLYIPAPHTAEVLADTLVEALMDWNIDSKVSTITIDNCTTNDVMINHLLQKLSTKDMPLDGKVLHMRCCAHILNLIVKDGLDIIGSSIERICDSVIYWTASPSRVEKFEETARQVLVNCTKKLCLD
ncbi:UNVERIFIED_CONTAM: hypothetical protein Sradi_2530100, partial [Sesamum radiatum]